jgi:hypothetical protein
MREANVCTEIVNSLKACGAWAYKIDDPRGFAPGIFHRPRPFDILFFAGTKGGAIEVKMIKEWRSLKASMFQDHQIQNLDTIKAIGGNAYCLLNVRIKTPYTNRLIILKWKEWGEIIKTTGIDKKTLESLSYCQGTKGLFNLYTLIGDMNK